MQFVLAHEFVSKLLVQSRAYKKISRNWIPKKTTYVNHEVLGWSKTVKTDKYVFASICKRNSEAYPKP